MKSYKISKIKVIPNNPEFKKGGEKGWYANGGELPIEKKLTEQFVEELPENAEANAELEKGEHIKYPNNAIQEVHGKTHEKGGVDLNLPEGSQIISDNLKVGKTNAKNLSKEFDIKVNASDTYAEALVKYEKSLGLDKLNKEQEDLFKDLKSEKETDDENTKQINIDYLGNKIRQVEEKKEAKNVQKNKFFEQAFNMQEKSKPKKDRNTEVFEDGGSILPKYADGDVITTDNDKFKYYNEDIDQLTERFKGKKPKSFEDKESHKAGLEVWYSRTKEIANQLGYGEELADVDFTTLTPEQYGKTAGILQSFYAERFPKGVKNYATTVPLNSKGIAYAKSQGILDKNLGNDSRDFKSPEDREALDNARKALADSDFDLVGQNFLDNEWYYRSLNVVGKEFESIDALRAFEENNKEVDNVNGNRYFSTVGSPEVLITGRALETKEFTPEGKKAFETEFKDANQIVKDGKTYFRVSDTSNEYINPITKEVIPAVEAEAIKSKPIVSNASRVSTRERGAQGFIFPNQSVLPPSALQPSTLIENRRQRIDPVRVGIEDNLTELFKQQEFVAQQIDNVPDSQRAASYSNLLASTQEQANKSITATNRINAQNSQQAELFNISQADAEDQLRGINLQNYERLTQTAQAKTEKDVRDYFDFNRRVGLNNFQNQQNLNLLQTLTPDFELDIFGNTTNFNPSSNNQITERKVR